MSRTGPPPHYRSENLPPPNTKGHGLLLTAAQAVVPRPYVNPTRSDYRIDTHSYHLFVEEICRNISIHEVLTTPLTNWNSTLSHLYYGTLLMYRMISARVEADQATEDEHQFVRIFETQLGVDHVIPQPLIPFFAHLGAVRLTDAYGIITPRGPEFSENTNRALNLEQRGICKIMCFPLIAFFLDSFARANPNCNYNIEDHDSPNAGFPEANFQFAGLHSNNPAHYSRIVSTPGFYPMLVHKSVDYSSARKYLRTFDSAEIRGDTLSPYTSLVDYLTLDWRNTNASWNFFKAMTEMHRELAVYFQDSISLSSIANAGTRTSLVEIYTLNPCALNDVEYSVVEERRQDDQPASGTSAATPAPAMPANRGRRGRPPAARTHSADVHAVFRQPDSTQLTRPGLTPLDASFRYRILYKLTDRHEIYTGSGLSFILTGPQLHPSLQADLRGPFFEDQNEDHALGVVPDPLRYQLYKLNAVHPAFNAKCRVTRMLRRALSTISHADLENVPNLKTLENA